VLAAASKVDAATKHSETMMTMLKTDTKYYEWSADDWVTYLKAAKGTIIKTRAWKHIKDWRSGNKEKRKAN
jgi:predicted NAD/FAD-binding protein